MKLIKSLVFVSTIAVGFGISVAQANPIGTFEVNGYNAPSFKKVDIYSPGKNGGVSAGMFDLKDVKAVDGSEVPDWFVPGNINSFCIEINEFISPNTVEYKLWDAEKYFADKDQNVAENSDNVKAKDAVNAINNLLSTIAMQSGFSSFRDLGSNALAQIQTTMWELAYDLANPISYGQDDFRVKKENSSNNSDVGLVVDNNGTKEYNDTYLGYANYEQNPVEHLYDLYVFASNPGAQDQLIWVRKTTVSAPATLGLLGLGLAFICWRTRKV